MLSQICTSEGGLNIVQARTAPALMQAHSESPSCEAGDQALAVRDVGQSCSHAADAEEVSRALSWQFGHARAPEHELSYKSSLPCFSIPTSTCQGLFQLQGSSATH